MDENKKDISNFNYDQKLSYVKSILFNNELTKALDILLKDEKKDLQTTKMVLSVLDEDLIINKIKSDNNLKDKENTKLYVYSRILAILCFYNKTIVLNNFFKSLTEDEIKKIAMYEYQNKTNVSFSSKVFNKYCFKYKDEALNDDEEEVLMLDDEKENKNNWKKNKILVFSICVLFLIFCFVGYKLYDYNNLTKEYDNKVLPGVYLDEVNLSGSNLDEVKNIVSSETSKIKNGTVTIKNVNGEARYTYEQMGISINSKEVYDEIKNYNDNLSFIDKVRIIKNNKVNKTFYLKATYNEDDINNFISTLENDLNTTRKDEGLVIDENHNVYYEKGVNGFTLDKESTKIMIIEALNNLQENMVIEVDGSIDKMKAGNEALSTINKKISSYTTYFLNKGNRGHNINLASTKLNGTILMPGDVFSYLERVGPYSSSNGYLPAPIYLNSEVSTANGGGVCQLATTLYMTQLKAGLETVERRNHTFAPNYVPKGLDATVYSTTTDYKFKNNYDYPIYITSYINGNYLTVDIWTNDAALGGKTFEPYSVYSNGAYLSYLKTIENGVVTNIKYLGKSVYKTMQ